MHNLAQRLEPLRGSLKQGCFKNAVDQENSPKIDIIRFWFKMVQSQKLLKILYPIAPSNAHFGSLTNWIRYGKIGIEWRYRYNWTIWGYMNRKSRYRLMVTISSTIVFILLFGLAHNNPPHKNSLFKPKSHMKLT